MRPGNSVMPIPMRHGERERLLLDALVPTAAARPNLERRSAACRDGGKHSQCGGTRRVPHWGLRPCECPCHKAHD